jgi:maleylpyruvate isomerase
VLVPRRDISHVASAHQRLLNEIERLTDEDIRRPSKLPRWSVAHVLTHVARNGDSHVRRVAAAVRGEMVDQYEGGYDGRSADIETGSVRSAAELLEDVRRSAQALDDAWRNLQPDAWNGRSRDATGNERPLFELPARRWQEVEVHLVDLDIGVSHREWPDDFVLEWLPRTREMMWARTQTGAKGVRFDVPADELAWFYGRLQRLDLPELPPWG